MPLTLIDWLPEDHSEESREELARGGLKTAFSLFTPAGWRTVDSPWEPRGEARRVLGEASGGEGSVLLLGSGSGFLVEELVSRGITEALIVTGSRVLAERTKERLEKAGGVSDSCSFTLLVCDQPARAWQEVVRPWYEQHAECIVAEHPREKAVFPALFGTLRLNLERSRRGMFQKGKQNTKRVLLFGAGGLLENEMIRAFKQLKFEVSEHAPLLATPLKIDDVFDILEKHNPYIILSTNLQGSDPGGLLPELCEQRGVAWGTWLLDDPRFILTAEAAMGAGRNRMAFCWDENGIDGWNELGFGPSEPLPLATDPSRFRPRVGDPSLQGRIVFVGSPRFTSAEGFFQRLDEDPQVVPIVELLIEDVFRTRKPPTSEKIAEALESLHLGDHLEPEAVRRLPAWIVQQANFRWRLQALRTLAPLKPVIYGEGWEGLLPDSCELRGRAGYDRDLPRIYSSDALHVSLTNLQMRSWPNQRLFDIPACGGCVITDKLSGLDELFGEVVKPLVFDSTEALFELAVQLKKDGEARRAHGEAMKQVVLERHTVLHRVTRMLETFERQ